MINVLHILSDTNIGGAGIYVVELTKALDKDNFSVYLACPKNAKVKTLIDSSVKVIETGIAPDKSLSFRGIYELVKIIKSNNINIVHTHASISGRIAAKLCGAKIVFTRHTPYYNTNKSGIKLVFNKIINNLLSNKVIAVSNYVKTQLVESGIPKEDIITVHNGIDVNKYSVNYDIEKIKQSFDIKDQFIILQIGRLEQDKGHEYLLKALALLDNNLYNYKLFIVGNGSKYNELLNLTKNLGIENNVIFLGYVEDVKPIIAASDIFVLPSLREALSIALIEAMCMGKPCIASKVGGIPEVLNNDSGILVEEKDAEELKNAIIKLHSNPSLRKSMGECGKTIVENNFSIDKMVKEVENIYYELVSQN